MITKPMLAADVDVRKGALDKLRFPLIGTPKFDGLRCVKLGGEALSRTFKPIRNEFTRAYVARELPDGMDGELLIPPIEIGKSFSDYTAGLTAFEGEPDFGYYVFDYVRESLTTPYWRRLEHLAAWYNGSAQPRRVAVVPWREIKSLDDLLAYEGYLLELGYEGVCLRSPYGSYKCGRSTFNEHWLLKLKRFADSEAEIIGFVERFHNTNEAYTNEVGHTKRSSAKAGKVPTGLLGAFKVRDVHDGREFEVGTGRGLDNDLRRRIWEHQADFLGKVFKYKYQEAGQKDKPRIGSYLGFRDPSDMGE